MSLKKLLKEVKTSRFKAKVKQVVFIFLLSLLISAWVVVFLSGVERYVYRSDFVSFINGAHIVNNGRGRDLYDLGLQRESQIMVTTPGNRMILLPYRNPPILAFFFIPFALLPLVTAYKIYTLILILVTLIIVWLSKELFKNLRESYWLVLPFIFYPSIVAIFAGQVSMFILLIFLLAYYFLKKGNALLLGVITGFLLLKPQYAIGYPFIYFLTKDRAVFLKGLFISSFLLIAGSILISGPGFLKNYFQMLVQTEKMIGEAKTSMFTLFFTLSKTTLQKHYIFMINLFLYLIAICYFYRNYENIKLNVSFCVAILFTLVFCIHGVIVDMAIVLLPIWILLDDIKNDRKIDVASVIVIFILILSPLGYILKTPYIIAFLFLVSVALLFSQSKDVLLVENKHK